MVYLYAYLGVAAALLLFSCGRRDGAENYSTFAHMLGLCALWPLTVALEAAAARSHAAWRREVKRGNEARRLEVEATDDRAD